MRMRAAQELRVNHARQIEIVGIDGLASALRHGVDLAQRFADHRKCLLSHLVTLAKISPIPELPVLLRKSTHHEDHEGHEGCKRNSELRDLRVLRGENHHLPISIAANSTACKIFV